MYNQLQNFKMHAAKTDGPKVETHKYENRVHRFSSLF